MTRGGQLRMPCHDCGGERKEPLMGRRRGTRVPLCKACKELGIRMTQVPPALMRWNRQ